MVIQLKGGLCRILLFHNSSSNSFCRIGFADSTGGSPLDWTLGAFVQQTVYQPELDPENLPNIATSDTLTFILLFAIVVLVILSVFYVSNWRKPRSKTIYDLEKGRYIVTHMPA